MELIAKLALVVWPVITLILISRYKLGIGSLMSIIGAYLFLPVKTYIDLPFFPAIGKDTIAVYTILIYMAVRGIPYKLNSLPKSGRLILWLFLLAPIGTAMVNQERYVVLPGLSFYDGISSSVASFIIIFPFLLGFSYFKTAEQQKDLFKVFAVSAFIYAFFVFYEIRMSPDLHLKLYGYLPHSWIQQKREGGFRAMVFIGHGLFVSFYLAVGVAMWAALKKTTVKVPPLSVNWGLGIVFLALLLNKTYSALLLALVAIFYILFLNFKKTITASLLMALLFISYPVLKAVELIPEASILSGVAQLSDERSRSLEFRFDQEAALLKHANEKILFGWGGWGRNRVFSDSGADVSTTDGGWIIVLGKSGWIGFFTTFWFFAYPVWRLYKKRNTISQNSTDQEKLLLGGHAMILGIILINNIPNETLRPVYWFLAGSLLGRVMNKESSIYKSKKQSGHESI